MKIYFKISLICVAFSAMMLAACSKTESYSDLLKKEQKVSNWYLAQHKVCNEIPADSVFLTGPDAPFYRMDDDGYVYMQVIKAPNLKDRKIPASGDQVYFTFTRYNIETMYNNNTLDVAGVGNQNDFVSTVGNTYFIFNNYSVSSSSQFGSGIQLPVSYLGYDSEVNILLKSYYGFSDESTTCIPYLVNTRYFKAEY
ncbi:MAG: DUF4827 domain-containing protein [Muribaculaceae bacterium]|nr:DUF4827 domain-containing protein [Muribaculaceae bacterium]